MFKLHPVRPLNLAVAAVPFFSADRNALAGADSNVQLVAPSLGLLILVAGLSIILARTSRSDPLTATLMRTTTPAKHLPSLAAFGGNR